MLVEYLITIAAAIALAVALQAFVVKPYAIPSVSMASTLEPGERVLIDRTVYHYRSIERGDIIVFRGPKSLDRMVLIKRVVGLPGDTLAIKDGHVLVNGRTLSEDYLPGSEGSPPATLPADSMNGMVPSGPWSLEKPYTVPEGHYFVMGDNRGASNDSRYWGTVAGDDVIGRAFFVYWPLRDLRPL